MSSSSFSYQGPCLPHCYSKNILFYIIVGVILGMLIYHIKINCKEIQIF